MTNLRITYWRTVLRLSLWALVHVRHVRDVAESRLCDAIAGGKDNG